MLAKPRYRLMIEGAPTEWVTDVSLEGTMSDGRVRRQGLMYRGLQIEEYIDLRESSIRATGITASIRSEYADAEFAYQPDYLAFLADDIDHDDASLTIDGDTGLISVDDVIHIGTEALKVTTVTTTNIGITRQYWDTQAQGHYQQVEENTKYVPIYNRVPSYEGRRCFLFAYDEGDTSDENNLFDFASNYQGSEIDTTDNVIWRGVISRPPRLDKDGITWLLDIEPITFLLEQEIAKTESEFYVKGVYHHALCGLAIICIDHDNSDNPTETSIRGFYATEEHFLNAVNTTLETLRTAAFVNDPQSLSLGWSDNDGYRLTLHTNSGTPSEQNVQIASPLMGVTGVIGSARYWRKVSDNTEILVGEGTPMGADVELYKPIDLSVTQNVIGPMTVPASLFQSPLHHTPRYRITNVITNTNGDRAILGAPVAFSSYPEYKALMQDQSVLTTYPANRLYIDRDPGPMLSTGSSILLQGQIDGDDYAVRATVSGKGTDATYGTTYIELDWEESDFTLCFVVDTNCKISVVSQYGGGATNIAGMIDGVIDNAVEANQGTTPFITYADIDPLWLAWLQFFLPYEWNFVFKGPATLVEVIREHLKLYGWYSYLNTSGQISFGLLESFTQTDGAIDATIDDSVIVTPYGNEGSFPKWEPAIDGVVSVVEISRGYDWIEDSFTESKMLTVRDVHSISTHKNRSRGVTKIEPKGTYVGTGDSIPDEEGFTRAYNYLALHSHDYDVVEFDVLRTVFDSVRCGSLVKVTSPHVPDSTSGTRGITNRVGMVIGRSLSLDPDDGSTGKITVRINRNITSGYTPSLRGTAYTVYSGYTYTITVTSTYFAPSGVYDTSFFAVGDKVRVTEFKSAASPNSQTGTVAAINSTTSVRVTLSTTFPTSASGLWDIEYDSDTGSLNDGQTDYCYVADSAGLLYNDTIGRRFA